eukprot:jgi/Mesen1/2745/ME000169S01917
MVVSDWLVGFLLLSLGIAVFSYYTVWVIVTPFMPEDHFLNAYFLSREYAIILPVVAGVILLSLLLIFVGITLFSAGKSKAKPKNS